MKLLSEEFEAARTALLDAATAIDAANPEEAQKHLNSLIAICSVIIDLVEAIKGPDGKFLNLRRDVN